MVRLQARFCKTAQAGTTVGIYELGRALKHCVGADRKPVYQVSRCLQ